jgi:hypothetical protein
LIDCQVHNALHFDRFGGKKAIIFDRRECSLLFRCRVGCGTVASGHSDRNKARLCSDFGTAKRIYKIRDLAKADVFDCIEVFYNRVRRHTHPGSVSPEALEMASV